MSGPAHAPHLADARLDDYADGLLDAPARAAAGAHVAECASCAARLEELRALLALSAAERRPVEPPPELWPLVVASTVERPRMRRRLLRSIRAPLAMAALVLVVLSSATTAWVVTRGSGRGPAAEPAVRVVLSEDAALDRALAAHEREGGPIPRERAADLRARLAAADDAIRRAPDDEALYRALAERERVVREIRRVLGMGPRPPRPPVP